MMGRFQSPVFLLLLLPIAAAVLTFRRRTRSRRTIRFSGAHGDKEAPISNEQCELTLPFGPAKKARDTFIGLAEAADSIAADYPDYYGKDQPGSTWLLDFEQEVATWTGKEAAMFVPSGTMAQAIVLCCAQDIHLGGDRVPSLPRVRRPFLAHPTSHVLLHENEGHKHLLGIQAIPCGKATQPLTCRDVEAELDASSWGVSQPCAVILEVPHRELGGEMTSLEEVKAMSALVRGRKVKFHMDGARIWEAMPYITRTHGLTSQEFCQFFDSVYVSFYKGLGGMTGAVLAGDKKLIDEARVWLRRFGGNLYTALPYAVSCQHALHEMGGSFESRWDAMAAMVTVVQGVDPEKSRIRFTPETPQTCMVHCHIRGDQHKLEQCRESVAQETSLRLFRTLRPSYAFTPDWFYFEFSLGPENTKVPLEDVEHAWRLFLLAVSGP